MPSGWRYRIQSVGGVVVLTAIAVVVVNSPPAHAVFHRLPVVGQLASEAPMGAEIVFEATVATAVVTAAFVPLYKPRPRRILDTVMLVQKRVVTAMLALAAIGYFDYTYRLPRATLIAVTPVLLVALPAWFTWIRRRPDGTGDRAIIIGNDPVTIRQLVGDIDTPLLGYLCSTSSVNQSAGEPLDIAVADGGTKLSGIDNLG